MSFFDADRIHEIESKRLEPKSFDRSSHHTQCSLNRWKHPWRLSDCTCDEEYAKDLESAKEDKSEGERKYGE